MSLNEIPHDSYISELMKAVFAFIKVGFILFPLSSTENFYDLSFGHIHLQLNDKPDIANICRYGCQLRTNENP